MEKSIEKHWGRFEKKYKYILENIVDKCIKNSSDLTLESINTEIFESFLKKKGNKDKSNLKKSPETEETAVDITIKEPQISRKEFPN